MNPDNYKTIAELGIIVEFIAFIILFAYPLSEWNDPGILIVYFVCLLCFLAFTGLLQFFARFLEIENATLLVSMFIAFTGFIIFLAFIFLGSEYIRIYLETTNPRVSVIFGAVIMWIVTAGIAKFMYRTNVEKALLVSLPLPLLVVVFFFLIVNI